MRLTKIKPSNALHLPQQRAVGLKDWNLLLVNKFFERQRLYYILNNIGLALRFYTVSSVKLEFLKVNLR